MHLSRWFRGRLRRHLNHRAANVWNDRRVDTFFKITERDSTISREIRGDVVSFFTMAYIIVLNPLILGFAYGSVGDCGGAVLMWGKRGGVWQQVWGGQSKSECADMKKHSIPVSIAGNQCWDGKRAVAYTG